MKHNNSTTVLIVPGLRDHVAEHWQTHLQARLPNVRSVPPLTEDKLNLDARVAAIQNELARIDGPVILVAHSAGVLMVAHWAARHDRPIKGALLVTPPDLDGEWPEHYPSPRSLAERGWAPLPEQPLPFPCLVVVSDNDPLASPQSVQRLARNWGASVVEVGCVGHLNPASGYGDWAEADVLINLLDR